MYRERVVGQTLLGEELTNDPEWLKIATRVSSNALVAVSEISAYPKYARLWTSCFIGSIKRIKRDRALASEN